MNIETSKEHREKEECYSVSAALVNRLTRLDEEWFENIIFHLIIQKKKCSKIYEKSA